MINDTNDTMILARFVLLKDQNKFDNKPVIIPTSHPHKTSFFVHTLFLCTKAIAL